MPEITRPEIDVELLEEAMSFIEAHPEMHEQAHWFNPCKTAFCFAGHVAVLSGVESPISAGLEIGDIWGVTADGKSVAMDDDADACVHGGTRHVSYYAQSLLGLTFQQGDALFSAYNTREVLRHLVDVLKADPEVDLYEAKDAYYMDHPREG